MPRVARLLRGVPQCRRKLASRTDPELGIDPVEMSTDRSRRDEQLLTDLTIREPLGRQLGDLQLLRCQLIAGFRYATPARLTRGAQLAAGLVAPRSAAERVEGVARGAQRTPRVGDSPPTPQPLTESKLSAGALERPAGEIGGERRPEALLGLGGIRK